MAQAHSALQHVLILGSVWPEPTSSAAGVRMRALIRFFREWMHARVTFCSAAKDCSFTDDLKRDGISCVFFGANDSSFDAWLQTVKPDAVVFDRFTIEEQFSWRIKNTLPQCVRILETVDLHSLRRARQIALEKGATLAEISQNRIPLETADLYRELSAIYRSDLSLIISNAEMELLTKKWRVPGSLLHLSRMPYRHLPAIVPAFDERAHFAWIGNFRHAPNADALPWICREIWPKIREKLPQAEFHIYGAYPSKSTESLAAPELGIKILGPCESVSDMLQKYRVSLSPLRFGAGIKGKISDSWFVGTPVVTTPIGAEGMTAGLPFGGMISETPDDIARSAVHLYTSEEKFCQMRDRGFDLIRGPFSLRTQFDELQNALQGLLSTFQQRREANTVGNMLWLNTLRSTEYFSRWIEEKNKRLPSA